MWSIHDRQSRSWAAWNGTDWGSALLQDWEESKQVTEHFPWCPSQFRLQKRTAAAEHLPRKAQSPREAFPLVKYMPQSILVSTEKRYQCQGTRQKGLVKLPGRWYSWNSLAMCWLQSHHFAWHSVPHCTDSVVTLAVGCHSLGCWSTRSEWWCQRIWPKTSQWWSAVCFCSFSFSRVFYRLLQGMTSRHHNSAPCNKSSHSQTLPHTHTLRPQ